MRCLIIGLDGDEKRFRRRKVSRKLLTYDSHNGSADVIILPYSSVQLESMSRRRIFKILRRISAELYGKTVCCCSCRVLEDAVGFLGVRTCDGVSVMIELIDTIIKKLAKNTGIDLSEECVGVYDCAFGENTAELIMNLSKCCSDISLYTRNVFGAQRSMQRIYDITGLPVTVTDDYGVWAENKRLAVLAGCFDSDFANKDILWVDICGNTEGIDMKKIIDVRFEMSDDFGDIFCLTDKQPDQRMVEFILETGAELELGKDIWIAGYTQKNL